MCLMLSFLVVGWWSRRGIRARVWEAFYGHHGTMILFQWVVMMGWMDGMYISWGGLDWGGGVYTEVWLVVWIGMVTMDVWRREDVSLNA